MAKKYHEACGAERVQVEAFIDGVEAQRAKAAPGKFTRRGLDPEIQALARLDRILSELDPDQAVRALAWLDGRYGAEARYEALAQERREVASE